jgi:hypothetical protein
MSLRMVTPANGAPQLSFAWDCGTSVLTAGSVLDVPVGGPLESAIGLTNLTALTGTALANVQGGMTATGTDNS